MSGGGGEAGVRGQQLCPQPSRCGRGCLVAVLPSPAFSHTFPGGVSDSSPDRWSAWPDRSARLHSVPSWRRALRF